MSLDQILDESLVSCVLCVPWHHALLSFHRVYACAGTLARALVKCTCTESACGEVCRGTFSLTPQRTT